MAATRAQLNRKVRQEALREQLSAQGHVQHIVDIVDKLRDPDEQIESDMVARYKISIDTKLKLVSKYLPDIKAIEITNTDDVEKQLDQLSDAELLAIAGGANEQTS
jgi:hypothetical protein